MRRVYSPHAAFLFYIARYKQERHIRKEMVSYYHQIIESDQIKHKKEAKQFIYMLEKFNLSHAILAMSEKEIERWISKEIKELRDLMHFKNWFTKIFIIKPKIRSLCL